LWPFNVPLVEVSIREDAAGWTVRDDAPIGEDDELIHMARQQFDLVLDEHDGQTRGSHLRHSVEDLPRPLRVELGRRLIQDDHGWTHREDRCHGQSLQLAAGQVQRVTIPQ
jgi:hypothetical protein